MENGKLPGYNRIGKRGSPGTFPGVPLKRLNGITPRVLEQLAIPKR
jgi:hypothetical protein